jgi:hypothetical protein
MKISEGRGRPKSEARAFVATTLLRGTPLTSIETTLLTGDADLAMQVSRMRRGYGTLAAGYPIKDRKVPHSVVFARIVEVLGAPATASPLVKVDQDHEFTEYYLPVEYVPLSMRVSDEARIIHRLRHKAGLMQPSFAAIATVRQAEIDADAADDAARDAESRLRLTMAKADDGDAGALALLPPLREAATALAAAAAKARKVINDVVIGLRPLKQAA